MENKMYLNNMVCTVVPIRGRWDDVQVQALFLRYILLNPIDGDGGYIRDGIFLYFLSLIESEMCNMSPLATGPVRDNEPLLLLFNGPN
jgi:hypothetical protein